MGAPMQVSDALTLLWRQSAAQNRKRREFSFPAFFCTATTVCNRLFGRGTRRDKPVPSTSKRPPAVIGPQCLKSDTASRTWRARRSRPGGAAHPQMRYAHGGMSQDASARILSDRMEPAEISRAGAADRSVSRRRGSAADPDVRLFWRACDTALAGPSRLCFDQAGRLGVVRPVWRVSFDRVRDVGP
jgi:hypothetical protein